MVKMAKMTDKDFEQRGNYFGVGVHEIYIDGMSSGKSPNTGSEFIEVEVIGEDDAKGNTRLYLTEKTAERTRSILSAIAVHSKVNEDDKKSVRDWFKTIDNTTQMIDQDFLDKFDGMQAWIKVEEDTTAPKPNGGYYLSTNLYSYAPKVTAADILPAAQTQTATNVMGGGEDVSASSIPF